MALQFLNDGYFAGKVGIGTSTPNAKLDVDGVIRSRGGTYAADTDTRTDVGLVIPENDFIYTADGNDYLRKLIGKSGDIITIGESGTSLIDGINLSPGTTGGYVQILNNTSVVAKFVDGKLGIGITTPTSKLHINQSVTDPDLDLPSSFAVEIDSNHSGSAATTGDREQGGLYIDVDSSTTGGDTSDEHRLYGIYNTVTHSGDSDLVYATYSAAEQNTTAGTSTNVFGINGTAISDGGTNAAVTNIVGVYGATSMQDATPVGNSHAAKFLNNSISNRTGATTNNYGISAEIQIESTSAFTNLFAGHFSIDSNATYTATNSYLLYLTYAGTSLATNIYSIYSPDDVKSYHEGNFGISSGNPESKLTVGGNAISTLKPTAVISDTTNGASLTLRGVSPVLYFDKTGTGVPKILMDGGGLQFKTGTLDSQGDIDVVITAAGAFGIGVDDPESKLQVAGGIQMADDTDAASADKVGTMRYRTGTEYVDVTGAELVINGSFATDTNWNKNSNWTISGGTANADGTSNSDINQSNNLPTTGSVYRVIFEITARTQGQVRIEYGDATTDFLSAVGRYEYILTATSTDRVRVQCQNSFIGSIDNLSIVEVTAEDASYADMCMQTGASTYEWVNIVRNTY
jgi:hypothetical protein